MVYFYQSCSLSFFESYRNCVSAYRSNVNDFLEPQLAVSGELTQQLNAAFALNKVYYCLSPLLHFLFKVGDVVTPIGHRLTVG